MVRRTRFVRMCIIRIISERFAYNMDYTLEFVTADRLTVQSCSNFSNILRIKPEYFLLHANVLS
jgi:hypothetical protein